VASRWRRAAAPGGRPAAARAAAHIAGQRDLTCFAAPPEQQRTEVLKWSIPARDHCVAAPRLRRRATWRAWARRSLGRTATWRQARACSPSRLRASGGELAADRPGRLACGACDAESGVRFVPDPACPALCCRARRVRAWWSPCSTCARRAVPRRRAAGQRPVRPGRHAAVPALRRARGPPAGTSQRPGGPPCSAAEPLLHGGGEPERMHLPADQP